MKLSMCGEFQLLKKNLFGEFVPMAHDKIDGISIGGYRFVVQDKTIPFDWDAFSGNRCEEAGRFSFVTGKGGFFNDYEIPDYWDDEYAKMGINRADLTAAFLASASEVDEFFVYFEDKDAPFDKECSVGNIDDNADPTVDYRVKLLSVSFQDVATGQLFAVNPNVLVAFNKGERIAHVLEQTMVHLTMDKDRKWVATIGSAPSVDNAVEFVAEQHYPVELFYRRTDLNGSGVVDRFICKDRDDLVSSLNWLGNCGFLPLQLWDFDIDKTTDSKLLNIFQSACTRRAENVDREWASLDDKICEAQDVAERNLSTRSEKDISDRVDR